jgi:hypothetical protein
MVRVRAVRLLAGFLVAGGCVDRDTDAVEAAGIEWGGRREAPARHREVQFAAALEALCPGLDYWLHRDERGEWLLVSWDFVEDGSVCATLRLDVDDEGFRGGWSPALLNWDDGVRAEDAGIDVIGPDGVSEAAAGQPPGELAQAAAAWFTDHQGRWPGRQSHHLSVLSAMGRPADGAGQRAPGEVGRAWARIWSAVLVQVKGWARSL